jgi:23S rRNA pseudouridine955/2504/2580 synthase/23S rRNA pseudouridine1911/1915/1917 synthase
MKRRVRFQIPRDWAGQSLIEFLARRFPYHSNPDWAERITEGSVRVNGRVVPPDMPLQFRDRVDYTARDVVEPPVSADVAVVYEDRDLMVINKPANLPCHPGGRYFQHTLWAWLKGRHGVAHPEFINRLDRETSGLVVVATGAAAARELRAQFCAQRVTKRYLAIVEGGFPERVIARGRLFTDVSAGGLKRRRFVRSGPDDGPDAECAGEWADTEFHFVERAGPLSVVAAWPRTGRMHQIRATLHGLGFPVAGDKIYGVDPGIFVRFCRNEMTAEDRRRLRLERQALHAAELQFRHPRTRRELAFRLDLPADMAHLLKKAAQPDGVDAA